MRAILGFCIAPGVPAIALYLLNLMLVSPQEAALLAFIYLTFAYLAALILGLPTYMIVRRRSAVGWRSYLVFGALIGVVFYALLFGIWGGSIYQSLPDHAIALLLNSAMACVSAIVYAAIASGIFWLIAVDPARRSSHPVTTG
jgi:hypothetical protein